MSVISVQISEDFDRLVNLCKKQLYTLTLLIITKITCGRGFSTTVG